MQKWFSGRLALLGWGGFLGLTWWSLYESGAFSPWLLALLYGLCALAIEGLLWCTGGCRRQRWASLLGVFFGLVWAPLVLTAFHRAGYLHGVKGFGEMLVVVGAMVLAGGQVGGRWAVSASRTGTLAGLVLLLGGGAGAYCWAMGQVLPELQPEAGLVTPAFPRQKVAVIGIDGGDWQVLDPLLEAGALPHLEGLLQSGRRGVLRSTDPSASPVVWTSIFSGHPPEVHGVKDWYRSDSRSRRVPMLWDIFAAHGREALVVNVPGSWPPGDREGVQLLSGFPIPGLTPTRGGQVVGQVVEAEAVELALAAPEWKPRHAGLGNIVLESLARWQVLPTRNHRVGLRMQRRDGGLLIQGDLETEVLLKAGEISDWVSVRHQGFSGMLRFSLLSLDSEGFALYVSPAFQDPLAPRAPFASHVDMAGLALPYVVEGVGWTLHRQPGLEGITADLVLEAQAVHTRAALALLAVNQPDLLAFVYTATDRLQHAFWSSHDASAYPEFEGPASLEGRDPVEEAYRDADEALGRLLARLASDTLVFVVSDHGVSPDLARLDDGEAGHRTDGIWAAAGPGITPAEEEVEMTLYDVVPTILRCMGAPLAQDMGGSPLAELCEGTSLEPVASYSAGGQPLQVLEGTIDASQEDQIRSLGYVE